MRVVLRWSLASERCGTREYTVGKPRGVYRIAVIGDSFIFGHGVNHDEVVSAVLEDLLNKTSAKEQF
jgi:hypothetical protein